MQQPVAKFTKLADLYYAACCNHRQIAWRLRSAAKYFNSISSFSWVLLPWLLLIFVDQSALPPRTIKV